MNIEIPIEGEGLADVELVAVETGSALEVLVIAVSAKTGIAVEELFIFEEDADEPLGLDLVIEEVRAGVTHHVHRARRIEITVNYLGLSPSKDFPPSARVQTVLDWAVRVPEFKIDATIAPEMELALAGETKELPKRAHIGRYVKHPHHRLDLDVIRGVILNG
jgi:hypothetical protein